VLLLQDAPQPSHAVGGHGIDHEAGQKADQPQSINPLPCSGTCLEKWMVSMLSDGDLLVRKISDLPMKIG
jgi:hypothetical protein